MIEICVYITTTTKKTEDTDHINIYCHYVLSKWNKIFNTVHFIAYQLGLIWNKTMMHDTQVLKIDGFMA